MSITENRKAWHDYFIEEKFEAGRSAPGGFSCAMRM
jgi:tmRNA-binding protein